MTYQIGRCTAPCVDFISKTDYHVHAASPCMNLANIAWSPAFDLDNGARPLPLGTNPDMGCY